MIYKGLNRIGAIGDIKTKGGGEVAEVYGGIGESNPIYYKQRDIVGTSPMQFKALGLPLKDYRIYGETLQDGTPSPDAPVDVVGCGVRTGNLFYKTLRWMNIDAIGRIISNSDFDLVVARVTAGETYSVTGCSGIMAFYVDEPDLNSRSYNNTRENIVSPVTIPEGVKYVVYRVADRPNNAMLNLGSTALPYEPYGYKLPLTVNGTEYPIYLGQVQTTRKIKKLVLDGTENWTYRSGDPANVFFMYLPTAKTGEVAMSNAYPYYSGTDFVDVNDKEFAIIRSSFAIRNSDYQYESQFKAYLAAQYAAGTPVTVWYVLATPETAIVNEPLHRIGEYADTISFAQAGVTIPTISGTNTLTVDTTVKPSEIDLTGRIKPSGYGQLLDKNLTAINDSTGMSIFIRG